MVITRGTAARSILAAFVERFYNSLSESLINESLPPPPVVSCICNARNFKGSQAMSNAIGRPCQQLQLHARCISNQQPPSGTPPLGYAQPEHHSSRSSYHRAPASEQPVPPGRCTQEKQAEGSWIRCRPGAALLRTHTMHLWYGMWINILGGSPKCDSSRNYSRISTSPLLPTSTILHCFAVCQVNSWNPRSGCVRGNTHGEFDIHLYGIGWHLRVWYARAEGTIRQRHASRV